MIVSYDTIMVGGFMIKSNSIYRALSVSQQQQPSHMLIFPTCLAL